MTGFSTLPYLEIGEACSPFDEAVILIDGHEEETIRIECEGALELAERIVALVNSHRNPGNALAMAVSAIAGHVNRTTMTVEQAAEISRRST